MTDPLLLTAACVHTLLQDRRLTNASGFFFERDDRLFLVTSRHVVFDAPAQHAPDALEIEVNVDADDLAKADLVRLPLYRDGVAAWHQAVDSGGEIDVAALEIDRDRLPVGTVLQAFTPQHLPAEDDTIEIGAPLLVVGFPLGFHDTLHHMPVARRAAVASAYGLRFDGRGYFLTDARTHRGTSGAPVVMRLAAAGPQYGDLPWLLLGVHSSRLDVGARDAHFDEALGLNCAWYADVLMTLTE